ncbi:MAG: saccharopine dehydrogenase NADP-binding domain-containing protein, partial [Myxococcales bacterium]|nr:saccharopine dehydrogenase NADP-binding domain-containing protein [Myxococcales bacterium]
MTRAHDIVLYGATGFTGGLVAEHLARVPGLSWALAGRNRAELEAARARLVGIDPKFAGLPLLDADASDAASLSRMAASARVVITTVGPYAELGEPLVRACVEAGTDYVDLTGEPAFVDRMIAVHGAAAREAKVKIVNACGFDSIPHDMGVLRTVRALDAEGPVRVRGYVEARGQFSGGTWHSAIGAFANPGAVAKPRHARKPLLPSALRR